MTFEIIHHARRDDEIVRGAAREVEPGDIRPPPWLAYGLLAVVVIVVATVAFALRSIAAHL